MKRNGELSFTARPTLCRFLVPLIAPDPRKYGQTLKEETVVIDASGNDQTSVMTVVNVGNTQAYPELIRVWGEGSANILVTRTDTGQDIILTQSLGAGANHYLLYPQTRTVLYGPPGSETSHYEHVGAGTRWFKLKADGAGTTIRLRRADTPLAQMKATLSFRDSWI